MVSCPLVFNFVKKIYKFNFLLPVKPFAQLLYMHDAKI